MVLAVVVWPIGSDVPLLVRDIDAEGNPTWGAMSCVLLATAGVARVFGVVPALPLTAGIPAAFARITQKRDHGGHGKSIE